MATKNYDIIIIGGGIGGIMSAYRLIEKNPNKRILLMEQGKIISKRTCPIIEKKTEKCIKCKSCGIMEGMAGAGAFSDGKYVISTEYGGWLTKFLKPSVVMDYIEAADQIMVQFGATEERFMPDNDLKLLCLQHDLHMQQAQLKHLGTDSNFETMRKLTASLDGKIEIMTSTEVVDINKTSHVIQYRTAHEPEATIQEVTADQIIIAVGRAGSRFFSSWCKGNKIPMKNNQVDVGVRVELPAVVWDHFSKKIYEPKIWSRSKLYGDTTRMFCFNDKGSVVVENTSGIMTVNGHSYRDPKRKTENSNFALLTTINFTEPFEEPIEYARSVASLANKISGGSVLIQRLGDLENGRRSNEARIAQSTTRPTLEAVPGDLSLCMPKRQLDNIIETLHALDKIAPGTANHDTLLYGVECKYYSAQPAVDQNFVLDGCHEIYAIGDGAGFTRSLSQAAAHGLYVADLISQKT